MTFTEQLAAPQILEWYGESNPQTGRPNPHLATIAGTFMSDGAKSGNRRLYESPRTWLEKAQGKIVAGKTVDMRSHHEAGDNTLQVVGKITRVTPEGGYEALVANTAAGRDLATLIEGGFVRHVSLRGAQPVYEPIPTESAPNGEEGWIKVTDLDLKGIDFTNNPGIGEASVRLAESGDGGVLVESFELGDEAPYWERDFSADQRKAAASSGAAMPDGSFPIQTVQDLKNAIHAIGRAKDPAAAKAHIIARARALGASNLIPDDWSKESAVTPAVSENKGATGTMSKSIAELLEDLVAGKTPDGLNLTSGAPDRSIAEAVEQWVAGRNGTATDAVTENEATEDTHEQVEEPAPEGAAEAEATEAVAEATPETETDATEHLDEAGRAISGANASKLQAAHDALAAMSGVQCGPDLDHDGESAPDAPINEAMVRSLVTEAVQTAVTERDATWATRLEEQAAAHAAEIQRVISETRTGRTTRAAPSAEQVLAEEQLEQVANMTEDERRLAAVEALSKKLGLDKISR